MFCVGPTYRLHMHQLYQDVKTKRIPKILHGTLWQFVFLVCIWWDLTLVPQFQILHSGPSFPLCIFCSFVFLPDPASSQQTPLSCHRVYLPLAVARWASVWTTKKCGRTPGWNFSSSSIMTSLQCLLPRATSRALAADCQSGTISYTVNRQLHLAPSQYTISRFREIRSSKSASGFDLAVSAAK